MENERLRRLLIGYGWEPDNIIVLDENTGTECREELYKLYRLVERGGHVGRQGTIFLGT